MLVCFRHRIIPSWLKREGKKIIFWEWERPKQYFCYLPYLRLFHRELHGFDIIAARPTGTESDCESFFTPTVTWDNNPFVECSSINWKSENVEVNSRKKS